LPPQLLPPPPHQSPQSRIKTIETEHY